MHFTLQFGGIRRVSGVSIKFEVGSWLKKNNRLYEQGAIKPINLGGSKGMLPQKTLKSGGSEMPISNILGTKLSRKNVWKL